MEHLLTARELTGSVTLTWSITFTAIFDLFYLMDVSSVFAVPG
jgi:hypothetical protein